MNLERHTKHKEIIVSLLRQVKKNVDESLSPDLITDNKMFWKQVKPFFSDKTCSNNEMISNPSTSAEILNNFFCDAVKILIEACTLIALLMLMIRFKNILKCTKIIPAF